MSKLAARNKRVYGTTSSLADLQSSSTPGTADTFLARSMPTKTMLVDFPSRSDLMRYSTSQRGTSLPYRLNGQAPRDGAVPVIR